VDGPLVRVQVAGIMERDQPTADRLVGALIDDGLCQPDRLPRWSTIRLPD
jgi:hypothetical protein